MSACATQLTIVCTLGSNSAPTPQAFAPPSPSPLCEPGICLYADAYRSQQPSQFINQGLQVGRRIREPVIQQQSAMRTAQAQRTSLVTSIPTLVMMFSFTKLLATLIC